MDERELILSEIRRCAAVNNGRPLRRDAFVRETGIRQHRIEAIWLRWSDAVKEAGHIPNSMQAALPDENLLDRLASVTRELGRYPLTTELRHRSEAEPTFPNPKTFARLGNKAQLMQRLATYCAARPEWADVPAMWSEDAGDLERSHGRIRVGSGGVPYSSRSRRSSRYRLGCSVASWTHS